MFNIVKCTKLKAVIEYKENSQLCAVPQQKREMKC